MRNPRPQIAALAASAITLLTGAVLCVSPDQGLLTPTSLGVSAHHATHVDHQSMDCKACHTDASSSSSASDLVLPSKSTCENCHLDATCEGPLSPECLDCHASQPRSHLTERFRHAQKTRIEFSHSSHADTLDCETCHPLHAILPDAHNPSLPSMSMCLKCHPHSETYAADHCTPCHLTAKNGTIAQPSATYPLTPKSWMHDAAHDDNWVTTHESEAAARPGFCAACHTDTECASCHAGKVKPLAIHPGDWINFHPVATALGQLRCTSCHSTQSFCITCHRKAGVAWDSPSNLGVPSGNVFHPDGWYSLSTGANKHALQAKKNLTSCVSCHTENDCISCHSSSALIPVSPHPPSGSWLSKCKTLAKKNPASCLKCHPSVDPACY